MDALDFLYVAIVTGLGLLAFAIMPSVAYLQSLHNDDSNEPKNVFLRVLAQSAMLINAAAFVVTALVGLFYFNLFNGEPAEWNLTGVALTVALALIITIPWRFANAMKNLGGDYREIPSPLTQDQTEDLRFGKERRKLEAEHVATEKKLDKQEPPVVK